ncbi:MAG: hypothetical protein H7838_05830 [Magnetococcus sp. DMHC-8]
METSRTNTAQGSSGGRSEPIPGIQKLLDNPFALLVVGVAVPTVLYTIWGIVEVISIPLAK